MSLQELCAAAKRRADEQRPRRAPVAPESIKFAESILFAVGNFHVHAHVAPHGDDDEHELTEDEDSEDEDSE